MEGRMSRSLAGCAGEGGPDDPKLLPATARLMRVRQDSQDWAGVLPRLRTGRTRSRLSLVPLAASLLAALLVPDGVFGLWSGGQREMSAAQALDVLAGAPTGSWAGYQYTRSEGAHLTTFLVADEQGGHQFSVLVPRTREIWARPDGSGRIRDMTGAPIFLGERDRDRWQAAGSPPLAFTAERDVGPTARWEARERLPTEPGQLADVLRQRAAKPGGFPPADAEVFVLASDLLREAGASPALRAALIEVIASIDGVELVGDVTDRVGRRGRSVAMTSAHSGGAQRKVLTFDPVTAALIDEETVLLERVEWVDATPPAVVGYTTYLDAGMVPALP